MRVSISLGLTLFTTTLFLACDSPSGPGSGGIPETAAPAPATKGYDITAVPRSPDRAATPAWPPPMDRNRPGHEEGQAPRQALAPRQWELRAQRGRGH